MQNTTFCIRTDASNYLLRRNENIWIDVLKPRAKQSTFSRDSLRRIQKQHVIKKFQCRFGNTVTINNLYTQISVISTIVTANSYQLSKTCFGSAFSLKYLYTRHALKVPLE